MSITAFIIFLFTLQAICFVVGKQSAKNMESHNDYFLAGKGVKFFPLMMTFVATQVGGGLVLGSAEEAYQYGWPVLLYPLGACLGLIFLGLGLGRKLAQFQVSTIAELFEVVYRSKALRKAASCLSILSLFMIFVAQVIASNKFMVSLGLESKFCFFLFWGIVIFYTSMGGLKAVVATDLIQASFFILVFFVTFAYICLYGEDFSALQLLNEVSSSDSFEVSNSKLFGWLLMPLLFMIIEQDMGQRCFAADSPKTVSKATLAAAFWILTIAAIPVFIGIWAKTSNLAVPAGASVLMTVIQTTTTPILSALVACAILAAIISTADSLINAVGSNLSQDFEMRIFKKDQVIFSQILSAGIAISGIAFSFSFSNIVDVLIQSYDLSVSCLFAPLLMALLKRKGNGLSAFMGIVFGATGFCLFKIIEIPIPKELASVLLSFVGFGLSELYILSRNMPKQPENLGI